MDIDIGEVHETADGFEWRIDKFFSLSKEERSWYTSPYFFYRWESWYFAIRPNGNSASDRVGYIDLSLNRESSRYLDPDVSEESEDSPKNMEFIFALKSVNGEKDLERHCTYVFQNMFRKNEYDSLRFISRSELIKRKAQLVPSGVLTVVCTFTGSAMDTTTIECSLCKNTFSAKSFSLHEKTCNSRSKCPECSDAVPLQSWYDHKCQQKNAEASLSDDFRNLLLSGDHSDTTVKVKEEEFRLHKCILAARSPYFDSMFKINMKECSTGIVTIHDSDPDIFRSFIHFLYCGKVDKLSPENVCKLYQAADKFQEDRLKKECLHFMLNILPVDKFCEYFVFAFTYNEKELLQKCIELFTTKGKEIVRSVQWQTFLKEYPAQANEMLIKTFDQLIK